MFASDEDYRLYFDKLADGVMKHACAVHAHVPMANRVHLLVTRSTKSWPVIRAATNKAWVLGDDRFRAKVEALPDRRVTPRPRGGDRRSGDYRESINRD